MRFAITFAFFALFSATAAAAPSEFLSRDAVADWIDTYRRKPEPARVPTAFRALLKANAFKDPESSGYYVGFLAGAIGADPARAEALVEKLLPVQASDQWVLVRAIAYSGLADWQRLLGKFASRLPARQVMIEDYLAGRLKPLEGIELDKSPTFLEKLQSHFGAKDGNAADISFGKNPELIDTLWGMYFATGAYRPVQRIIEVLPWSKDNDSLNRLAVGSSAKYTLASNGTRYPDLLAMLKRVQRYQPADVQPVLAEAIRAAETVQASRIKKEQYAAIEELRRKGPGYKRQMSMWSYVGQGAIALGCIALAAAGQVEFGIPCVVGGAMSSALMNYWSSQ